MKKKIITFKVNDQNDFEQICNHHVDEGYEIIAAGFTPSSIDPKNSDYRTYRFKASFWWAVMRLKEENA